MTFPLQGNYNPDKVVRVGVRHRRRQEEINRFHLLAVEEGLMVPLPFPTPASYFSEKLPVGRETMTATIQC